MFPSHVCVLKGWGPRWGDHRVGLCELEGCIMETLSLRRHKDWVVACVNNLTFWGRALSRIPLLPFSLSIPSQGYFLESIWELLWSMETQIRQQWLNWAYALLHLAFPSTHLSFCSCHTFPHGFRSKKAGPLRVSGSIWPLFFSISHASPLPPHKKRLSPYPFYLGSCLKLYFASS